MVAVVQTGPNPVHRPDRPVSAGARRAAGGAVPPVDYQPRRAVAGAIVVTLLVAVQGLVGLLGHGAADRPRPRAPGDRFTTHVVQPGDTLWSIARRAEPDRDPRPLVDRLVAEHGGAVLQVGERIALPERR